MKKVLIMVLFIISLLSISSCNKEDNEYTEKDKEIAASLNMDVETYCELYYVKRGYCSVHFDLITETPKQTADGEITGCFARRLEATIRRAPAYWFWSHKRWKLKREDAVHHG